MIHLGAALRGVRDGIVLNFAFISWTGEAGNNELCADGGNIPNGFAASGFATHREYCIRIIAVHEFGHALGFTHEDHRSDRFGCAEPHTAQGTPGDYRITAYDLQSVMNYCNPQWNGNGRLSFRDRWSVVAVYGGWSPDFAITPDNAAAGMTYAAVVHRDPDELHIFYQGTNRGLGTNWSNRKINVGVWQRPFGITPPGAARAGTPVAAVTRGKQLHVFYIGPDNALATTWTDGGPWIAPFPITPPRAARDDSPLTATVRSDELHVFYIGPDGALASTWAAPNVDSGRWRAPFPISPPGAAGPTSRIDVVLRDRQLHVFYQGGDRAMASTWAAPDVDGGRWHSPFPITASGAGRPNSPIAALARNADKLDVHYIGPDGAVATAWANTRIQGGRWQQPFPVTPPGFARDNAALTATSRFDRMMDLFYVGQLGELKTLWANDPRAE